jgi:Ca2+-binding EF-hand superfamily protein
MPGKPTDAQIKAAFDAFDADKSGQISTVELEQILTKCGVKVNSAQCSQLIKMFDADNSGLMEYNEFQKLIEEALKHAK